jgi:DEAD/DEAH box helicase domain-containing protein
MILFFDLETQRLAAEVGGWSNIEALRVAVACTFDEDNGYRDWWESQAGDLLEELERARLIVGYNINAFDFRVLSPYGSIAKLEAKAFDIFDEIWQQTHKRVSLNAVCMLNLGEAKTHESGVAAVQLYRTGMMEELIAYCRRDVELTRRLFEAWEAQGILWVTGQDYAVWPGVHTAADLEEEEDEE